MRLSRLIMISAIIAMLLGACGLLFFIPGIDAPIFNNLYEAAYCEGDERIVRDFDGGGFDNTNQSFYRSFTYLCQADDGSQRDVTGSILLTNIFSYIVIMGIGGVTLLISVIRRGKLLTPPRQATYSKPPKKQNRKPITPKSEQEDNQLEKLRNILQHIGVDMRPLSNGHYNSMNAYLDELEKVFNQGNVSEDEYHRLREEIIRTMKR